jgi:predicted RNase H-related nuclease YkuK (DUF458 family)
MERYFRTADGRLINLLEHIIQEVEKNPHLCIYIGTDSQNERKRRTTVFATVVVFRYGTRGAHFVYLKQKVAIIQDRFTRLFEEAVKTIELAEMITGEIPVKIEALEFDYNAKKKTESTKVIPAARGWAESLGYRVNVKPETLLAIKAADHICRKK